MGSVHKGLETFEDVALSSTHLEVPSYPRLQGWLAHAHVGLLVSLVPRLGSDMERLSVSVHRRCRTCRPSCPGVSAPPW